MGLWWSTAGALRLWLAYEGPRDDVGMLDSWREKRYNTAWVRWLCRGGDETLAGTQGLLCIRQGKGRG